MVIIESADGKKENIECIGCSINKGIVESIGGNVFESKNFRVSQDYEVPITGFFVIASKRHIISFADFQKTEEKDFINILCRLRKGMRDVLGIKHIQIFYREDTIESKIAPSHFHMALLPKYSWMNDWSVSRIFEYAKKDMKTEDNLGKVKEAIVKIREYMGGEEARGKSRT